ncbi:hypothetical protein HDU67_008524 [Dinochytrium kinnereticum]|nr:hypothetical protein HDU67_008524 [Dinochytrium kinnereticum]
MYGMKLAGQLPDFSPLTQVTWIELGLNDYTTFTDVFESLAPNLVYLSFHNNRLLTGNFPASVSSMRSLKELLIYRLSLSGGMPDMSALTGVTRCDTYENKVCIPYTNIDEYIAAQPEACRKDLRTYQICPNGAVEFGAAPTIDVPTIDPVPTSSDGPAPESTDTTTTIASDNSTPSTSAANAGATQPPEVMFTTLPPDNSINPFSVSTSSFFKSSESASPLSPSSASSSLSTPAVAGIVGASIALAAVVGAVGLLVVRRARRSMRSEKKMPLGPVTVPYHYDHPSPPSSGSQAFYNAPAPVEQRPSPPTLAPSPVGNSSSTTGEIIVPPRRINVPMNQYNAGGMQTSGQDNAGSAQNLGYNSVRGAQTLGYPNGGSASQAMTYGKGSGAQTLSYQNGGGSAHTMNYNNGGRTAQTMNHEKRGGNAQTLNHNIGSSAGVQNLLFAGTAASGHVTISEKSQLGNSGSIGSGMGESVVEKWSTEEVAEWLVKNGVNYSAVKRFKEHSITGRALLSLTEMHMERSMGIQALGDRLAIASLIATLKHELQPGGSKYVGPISPSPSPSWEKGSSKGSEMSTMLHVGNMVDSQPAPPPYEIGQL